MTVHVGEVYQARSVYGYTLLYVITARYHQRKRSGRWGRWYDQCYIEYRLYLCDPTTGKGIRFKHNKKCKVQNFHKPSWPTKTRIGVNHKYK